MITKAMLNKAFNKQLNLSIAYLIVFEVLFALVYYYFDEFLPLESQFLGYLFAHTFIAFGLACNFFKNVLADVLITDKEEQ